MSGRKKIGGSQPKKWGCPGCGSTCVKKSVIIGAFFTGEIVTLADGLWVFKPNEKNDHNEGTTEDHNFACPSCGRIFELPAALDRPGKMRVTFNYTVKSHKTNDAGVEVSGDPVMGKYSIPCDSDAQVKWVKQSVQNLLKGVADSFSEGK